MRKKNVSLWLISTILLIFCFNTGTNQLKSPIQSPKSIPETPNYSLPSPKAMDISGNELFAEQILVGIAGSHTLVQQSYLTNDTNIFSEIDFSDPAFTGCAFFIELSNKIPPELYPLPYSLTADSMFQLIFEGVKGFLYFEAQDSFEDVYIKKDRVLQIIRNVLGIDLIFCDQIEDPILGYYYSFFGVIPSWSRYLDTTILNIPRDGYWNVFDMPSILASSYLNHHYLGSSFLFLKQYNLLTQNLPLVHPDPISTRFDLSALNSSVSIVNLNPNDISNVQDSTTESRSLLDSLDNVVFFSVQYEGGSSTSLPNSNGQSQYSANLFNILNYHGNELGASRKVFNSLDGISLSSLRIGLYTAEVVDSTPTYIGIDPYNFELLENILFLLDEDVDFSFLLDYSFKIGWRSNESLTQLVTSLVNLENASDPINFLEVLGGSLGTDMGIIMGISSAITNPLTGFEFIYQTNFQEPSLSVEKYVEDGSIVRIFQDGNTPTINLLVYNPTNFTIWGQERNLTLIGITNDPSHEIPLFDLNLNFFELLGADSAEVIQTLETLGYTIPGLFHQKNPRFFNIDANNTGSFDITYPDLRTPTITRIFPYSPEFTQILLDNPDAFGSLNTNPQLFNSSDSIFNPTNWKLDPGSSFSLNIPSGQSNLTDQYASIGHAQIHSIPSISPLIIYGSPLSNSNYTGTFVQKDGNSWSLQSENLGFTHQIQFYVSYANITSIDLDLTKNRQLDALKFDFRFKNSNNATLLSAEILNWTFDTASGGDQYITLSNFYDIALPEQVNYTLSNNNYNLSDFFTETYGFLLRLTFSNSESFSIEWDYCDVHYQDRLNQMIYLAPSCVQFCTEIGHNQYYAFSNSMQLNTDEASSITVQITMSNYSTQSGDSMDFFCLVINQGSITAHNFTLTIVQPGIIADTLLNLTRRENNGTEIIGQYDGYSLTNGELTYYIAELLPFAPTAMNFSFRIPNSILSPPIYFTWNDANLEDINHSFYLGEGNRHYLSAPSLYQNCTSTPFFHHIKIEYIPVPSSFAPTIGEEFSIELNVTNIGTQIIWGLELALKTNWTGFELNPQSTSIYIEKLDPNNSSFFSCQIRKTTFQGYVIPLFHIESSLEPALLAQYFGSPIIIGEFNLSVKKDITISSAPKFSFIDIVVQVTNNGNIEVGNFVLNDIAGYDASAFILINGLLFHRVALLQPNESYSFTYRLQVLNKVGIYEMKPAFVEYYFIYQQIISSASVEFKVYELGWQISLGLYGPIFGGILCLLGIYGYKMKYSREDFEILRREKLLFGQSLRESAWHKKNLIEFLDSQDKSKSSSFPSKEEEKK